jgi:hypothetical protein
MKTMTHISIKRNLLISLSLLLKGIKTIASRLIIQIRIQRCLMIKVSSLMLLFTHRLTIIKMRYHNMMRENQIAIKFKVKTSMRR